MRINTDKTKVELFKTARKYDFTPTLSIDDNTNMEVVEEFCLLGVHFLTSMSWQANTDNMYKNGYSRIWMLRRFRRLGASHTDIFG